MTKKSLPDRIAGHDLRVASNFESIEFTSMESGMEWASRCFHRRVQFSIVPTPSGWQGHAPRELEDQPRIRA